jgi:hypothetical protein
MISSEMTGPRLLPEQCTLENEIGYVMDVSHFESVFLNEIIPVVLAQPGSVVLQIGKCI